MFCASAFRLGRATDIPRCRWLLKAQVLQAKGFLFVHAALLPLLTTGPQGFDAIIAYEICLLENFHCSADAMCQMEFAFT